MKMGVHRGFVPLSFFGFTETIVLLFHTTCLEAVAPRIYKVPVTQSCPLNKFVTVYANGTKRCSRCTKCHKGFEVQINCSAYNDTICAPCPSGWYNDVRGSRCKPCAGCEAGEYIRRGCVKTRNTKCRKCPRGTYSAYSNVTSCLPCKRCRENEKTVSKCSTNRDTICGDCFEDHFRVSSTDSCFPCSPCPSKLQNKVVPECRKKLGIHHSSICWPSLERDLQFSSIGESLLDIDIITEKILHTEWDEHGALEMPYTFITILLGSFLFCIFIIVGVFIFLRSGKCGKFNSAASRDRRQLDGISTFTPEERDNDDGIVRTNDVIPGNSLERLNSTCSSNSESEYTSVFTNESLPLKFQDMLCETDGQPSAPHWPTDCTRVIS